MNNLEQLKQKLMVKPNVQERERVAVVIKGEKTPRKNKRVVEGEKKEKTIGKQLEEGVIDLSEQISEIQQMEGILPVKVDVDQEKYEEKDESEEAVEEEFKKTGRPIIIDKTEQGYDIETLLKKLADNKKTRVTVRPIMEKEEKEEKMIQPVIQPVVKKAKKNRY